MIARKKISHNMLNVLTISSLPIYGITDTDMKKLAFLAVIGLATYTLVRNLVSPDKLGEKSYDELVKTLKDHFIPTPLKTI